MADSEVKIIFRTEAELSGAQSMETALEKQIGVAKALGKDYGDLEEQRQRVNASIQAHGQAQQAETAAQEQARVAAAALAEAEGDVADSVLRVTAEQAAKILKDREMTQTQADAAKQAKTLEGAISSALNPLRLFRTMLTGFVSGVIFGGMTKVFAEMADMLGDLIGLTNELRDKSGDLIVHWKSVNQLVKEVETSAKAFTDRMREADEHAASIARNYANIRSLQQEQLNAEDRVAAAKTAVDKAKVERLRSTGKISDTEAATRLAAIDQRSAGAALERQKKSESLAVSRADDTYGAAYNDVLRYRNKLAEVEKARPTGTPQSAGNRISAIKAQLELATSDREEVESAQGDMILSSNTGKIIERRTGISRTTLGTGLLPGTQSAQGVLENLSNQLSQEIASLTANLKAEEAHAKAIEVNAAAAADLRKKLQAAEEKLVVATEGIAHARELQGIRTGAAAQLNDLGNQQRTIELDTSVEGFRQRQEAERKREEQSQLKEQTRLFNSASADLQSATTSIAGMAYAAAELNNTVRQSLADMHARQRDGMS